MKVVNSVFGSTNPSASKIKMLNVQQKFVLAIATLIDKWNQDPASTTRIEMTVGKIYDVYLKICNGSKSIMDSVSRTEFFDLISAMETTGIIHFGKSNGPSFGTPQRAGSLQSRMSGTPTNGNRVSTPTRKTPMSTGKFGTPKNKGSHGLDTNSVLLLTADENDLSLGIAEVPFLKEFFLKGLPLNVVDP
jgi:hypothetical protein